MFKKQILLITGGTGSFGNAVLERFLNSDVKEIRIFSRDEKKQDDMRHNLNSDKVKFYIGDVRDKQSVDSAMKNVDFVFHAAALKQVPSCEFFPMQAVQTNIIGANNVLDSAIENCVKKVEKNIGFVKGVTDLKCDLPTKTVNVSYRTDKTSEKKIVDAFKKIAMQAKPLPKEEPKEKK